MNYGRKATEKKIKEINSKGRRFGNKIALTSVKIVLLSVVLCAGFGISMGVGMIRAIIANAPEINIDSIVPQGLATTVYDNQGSPIATLVQEGSNRDPATYDEFPEDLINAFVAIEDARFWKHNGIDLRSILRAVRGVLTHNSSDGGGSTITQQLIKNNVFAGGREASLGETLERKFQEQYLAVQLTKTMDRELILTNYLNTINLGNNCLGVKVAARRYFNKEVSDLTLSECAVIAGITQNPSTLNPISGQEKNAEKRELILSYMKEQGYIDEARYNEAMEDDVYSRIQLVDTNVKDTSTIHSYFVDELTRQARDALIDKLGYTENQAQNLLYSGGLQIMTTQDPDLQAIVDEEVNDPDNYPSSMTEYSLEYRLSVTHADGSTQHYNHNHIRAWHQEVLGETRFDSLYPTEDEARADIDRYKDYLLKEGDEVIGEYINITMQPQVSFTLIEQSTGYVKAISGGRGAKTANLTLNRATNAPRQPGSAFKVVTSFAPAIDACGANLGTVYYDAPYTVGSKTFSNWYSSGYQGYSSIREGIIYSMNIVAVRCLMETVTPQVGVEYAQNMGITTLTANDYIPALALGGIYQGVTNLELTGAYASIANGGVYKEPIFFTQILDRNGKILLENEPETRRVLKDSTAFLLTDAMKDSMISSRKFSTNGPSSTSTRARLDNMSCAGKSGTTTSNVDVWFVGFTPYYTAGVWAGYDLNQSLGSGETSFHKDIWKRIMDRIHEGLPDPGFTPPYSVETATICRKSGKLAIEGICSGDPRGDATYTEYFARGEAPTEFCDVHVAATVCAESGGLSTGYCPEKVSRICISLPEGSDAAAATDDSQFAIPGPCTVHTDPSTAAPDENGPSSGPGYNSGPGYSNSSPGHGSSAPGYGGGSGAIVPAIPSAPERPTVPERPGT